MSLASRIALRTGFVLIIVLAAGAALATAGFFLAKKIYEADLPSVEAVRELPLQVPLRIYTRDGKLIGEFGAERRFVWRGSDGGWWIVWRFRTRRWR